MLSFFITSFPEHTGNFQNHRSTCNYTEFRYNRGCMRERMPHSDHRFYFCIPAHVPIPLSLVSVLFFHFNYERKTSGYEYSGDFLNKDIV